MAAKKPKKRGPKNKVVLTETLLNLVESLYGKGITDELFSSYAGIAMETWRKSKQDPLVIKAISLGKSKVTVLVLNKLYDHLKAGYFPALCFYLKTQLRWTEVQRLEIDGESKVDLNIKTTDPVEASKIYQQIMTGKK